MHGSLLAAAGHLVSTAPGTAQLRVLAILLTLGLIGGPASAQETTGGLRGRVVSRSGGALADAQITATGPSLQGGRLTVSDANGTFLLLTLPPGPYTLRVVAIGHRPLVIEGAIVQLGRTAGLGDLVLGAEPVELGDVVIVAPRLTLTPMSTDVGGILRAEDLSDLPIERDYRWAATLLPHVNNSYFGDGINFAGGTGLENKYFIDGVDNTELGNGFGGTSLPYNFVEEIQVRTGAYQAEHPAALGGIVNAVTRSGGNDFSGEVFGFFLNNSLTTDPRLTAGEDPPGDFANFDVGASVGGAIRRDQLWYFAALNPSVETRDVPVAGLDVMQAKRVAIRFAGKLNWRVNAANAMTLSVLGDPSHNEGPGFNSGWHPLPTGYASAAPVLRENWAGGYTAALSGQHWLRDDLLLQSDVAGFWQRHESKPTIETGELYFYNYETGIVDGGSIGSNKTDAFAGSVRLAATLLAGRHTVKAGIGYRDKKLASAAGNGSALLWRFTGGETFQYLETGTVGTVHNRIPSAYLQDSWQVGERLQLNIGVRWEGQNIIDSKGHRAQSINDQWQPRIGFTWRPGEVGNLQLFGSAGRFYQDLALRSLAVYFNAGFYYHVYQFDTDPRVSPPADTTIGFDWSNRIQAENHELRGQYYDEITLGLDRRFGTRSALTVRGIYRTLGEGIEDAWPDDVDWYYWGNPGRGSLASLPPMTRRYAALELTFRNTGSSHRLFASYVWSRNHGNYSGIWPAEYGGGEANANANWDDPNPDAFSTGPLPNDRPHVFKLSGSSAILSGLQAGLSLMWMSGTPLNEFGPSSYGPPFHTFLVPRGTAGRMPSVWDLGLRLSYRLRDGARGNPSARVLVDLLHVGSPRTAVDFEQLHFSGADQNGDPIPNPTYGLATRYLAPMALRLGLEARF